MESFVPTTPTVYIRVTQAASRLQEFTTSSTRRFWPSSREWPYIPHITIAQMPTEGAAQQALQIAREHWRAYSGSRRILLERLTFVREDAENCWVDLAPVPLGGSLVSP